MDKIGYSAGLEVGVAAAAIIDPGVDNESLTSVLHQLKPLLAFESKTDPITNHEKIEDELVPTPYTLWQFPKSDVYSYFYYLTDEHYAEEDSKYRLLDDQLNLMGRHRTGLEVGIFDRDRMREQLWQVIIEDLAIDDYPALIVSEGPLGIGEIDLQTESFQPKEVDYAKMEKGVISEHILQDSDKVRDLLNSLFEGARDNDISSQMRKRKVLESLTIAKEEVQGILSITNSI